MVSFRIIQFAAVLPVTRIGDYTVILSLFEAERADHFMSDSDKPLVHMRFPRIGNTSKK